MTAAAQLLDRIVPIVRTRLPRGVDVDYLDDFLGRNRPVLEAVIAQNLWPLLRRMEAANNGAFGVGDIPEFWTAAKRTAANIAARAMAATPGTRHRGARAARCTVVRCPGGPASGESRPVCTLSRCRRWLTPAGESRAARFALSVAEGSSRRPLSGRVPLPDAARQCCYDLNATV